jgi:hypothetical protein
MIKFLFESFLQNKKHKIMSVNDLTKIEFYVQNQHRTLQEGPLDWVVVFPQGMSEITATSFYLQVDSACFLNRIPTIMSGVNDTFTYEYSLGNDTPVRYSLVFSRGNYDVNDIMTTLLVELQLRNAAFDLEFDDKQQLLSIFVPANVTFSIVRPLFDPYSVTNYAYNNANDRFLELIGWSFVENIAYTIQAGASGFTWTPPCPVRLDGTSFIHVNVSSSISAYTSGSKGYRPVASFPVTAGFNSLVVSTNNLQSDFEVRASDIQHGLRFFITDEWGTNLTNHVDKNMPFHLRFSLRAPL